MLTLFLTIDNCAFNLNPITIPIFHQHEQTTLNKTFIQQLKHLEESHLNIDHQNENNDKQHNKKTTKPIIFLINDWISIKSTNINLTNNSTLSKKLLSPYIGPFQIINKDNNNNYTIDLPSSMSKTYSTFHISLLKPRNDPQQHFPTRIINKPYIPDVDEENIAVWEVENIVDHKLTKRKKSKNKILYLVK